MTFLNTFNVIYFFQDHVAVGCREAAKETEGAKQRPSQQSRGKTPMAPSGSCLHAAQRAQRPLWEAAGLTPKGFAEF